MNSSYALNNHTLLSDDKRENPLVTFLLTLLILLMGAILVSVSVFQLFHVKGDSMEKSYFDNDFVLLQKDTKNITYKDIVIIDAPETKDGNKVVTRIIKRIIALEGETIMFVKDGTTILLHKKIDGKFQTIDESSYIKNPMTLTGSFLNGKFRIGEEYTVPKDEYFFLGDNRDISKDGRSYGFLNLSTIVASKVVYAPPQGSITEFFLKLIFGGFKQTDQ